MQRQEARYPLLRRILFPYSAEEPLTRKQGLRVVGVWMLLFLCPMLLCIFPLTLAVVGLASWMKVTFLLLIVFLSGVVIFCVLAWLVVVINNRAAQIQQQKAARTGSTNGGRYGS